MILILGGNQIPPNIIILYTIKKDVDYEISRYYRISTNVDKRV